MSEQLKRYIAGPKEKVVELFPNYHADDERLMPDGKTLIEVNLNDDEFARIGQIPEIIVMTHAEALVYVQSFEKSEGK